MDYFLIGLGILLLILGILGAILPVLPGPPLNYVALLLLHFTAKYQFSAKFLITWAIITIVVSLLDYVIPAWGTKKFGGSKRGIWGSVIGLIIGMFFFPPFGIIIGPIAGAVIGEFTAGKSHQEALRAGLGSFVGFLAGTMIKLIASGMMAWYFFAKMI
ncbi:MAG: DUF456 domain-containing protein [Mangrovibacterium sp.]|jgi:uncharacterized protein YqgC (DUF456 family)